MVLSEIIEVIKKEFAEHEDLEEIITDLNGNDYFDHWAKKMCDKDELNNLELGKALFILQEEKSESSSDYRSLGEDVFDSLNDTEWALDLFNKAIELSEDTSDTLSIADSLCPVDQKKSKDLYLKVETNLDNLSEFNNLISSVNDNLEDKEWALKLLSEAEKLLLDSEDKFEFSGSSNEVITLAERSADEDLGNNKDSAREIFEILKEYEGITDLLDAARAVKETFLDSDEEYTQSYMNECLNKAIENIESGYYCDVYNFINDDLEDQDRAESFKDEYIDELQSDHKEYGGCEELFEENDSIDVDTDSKGYFKIEVISTGGEYAFGFISDEENKTSLLSMIENDEDIYPDNDAVPFYDCDTQFFHVYGPEINSANISILVYEDEECENEIEEVIYNESIDSVGVNYFAVSNPYIDENVKESLDSDSLMFGGYKIEKRIHFPAVVEIKDDEQFNIHNVYIGSVNMDETLANDEITERILYIREDDAQKLLSLYDVEDEELSDYLGEIFSEMYESNEEVKEILDRSTCEVLEIEGKGEWENQFTIIKNFDEETLYEKELD